MKRILNEIIYFIANHYTFLYNLTGAFGIIIAPLCGFLIDYKAYRGL
jgi:hypothetical protein